MASGSGRLPIALLSLVAPAMAVFVGCSDGSVRAATNGSLVRNNQPDLSVDMTVGIGHLPMRGCAIFDYLAYFNVGGQRLNLLVDSGSTTLAVAARSCSTCGVNDAYQPSTTAQSTPYTASSRYLDGSEWVGGIVSDDVAGGDTERLATPPVPVQFVAIQKEKDFFEPVSCVTRHDTDFDGIIGIGPDAQLEGNTTSFLTALYAKGSIANDMFAIKTCDVGGDLWFGGYDVTHTRAAPEFTPLIPVGATANRNNAYAVNVLQMALGGVDFALAPTSLGPMVVDNGTSVVILTPPAYAAFLQIASNHPVVLDNFGADFLSGTVAECLAPQQGLSRDDLDAQLPRLSFTFPRRDGSTFVLDLPATKSYLVAGIQSGDASKTVRYCPAVIAGAQLAIIGNVAMRDHVVIFDRAQQQVGFAPQSGCVPSSLYLRSGT